MSPASPAVVFPEGVFTLSLDFELIWGTIDLFGPERFRKACEVERSLIGRLLDLFAEYNVSATWCILGHLFLDSCRPDDGCKHPEIVRPNHAWNPGDWFHHDPCGTEQSDPLFYGRSLIETILSSAVPQEIGCHSFSHVIFGDPGCSAATAESEVGACVQLARSLGVEMRSFAFPRNSVGWLDVLRRHGFDCFRGPEPNEVEKAPHFVTRLMRLWDVLRAAAPPVVLPEKTSAGLWNIPGSMIYFPMHGFRRHIPLERRVTRAVKGLEAAVRQKRLFHLWFHPTNLADQSEQMFLGLSRILQHARRLCDRGELKMMTMGQAATAAAAMQDRLDAARSHSLP